MDFKVPLGVAFGVDFVSFRKNIAPGDDFIIIFGSTFAGSTFLSIFHCF